METVRFTAMEDGTKEDYELLGRLEESYYAALPGRLADALRRLEHSYGGYQVSRLEHSLQSASRAYKDGRDDEYVVSCLLHDIGDELAPHSHSELAAAVLRPFVSPELYFVVKHHGLFQMYYYAHHTGGDRNSREALAGHRHYDACAEFCACYDQNCFDPAYPSRTLQFFEPVLARVTGAPRYDLGAVTASRSGS